jgi:ribonuclease J
MKRSTSASVSGLVFLPLGGAGEIGMNLGLYGFDDRWIMVDCGLAFADDTLPGVDVVVPDPRFIAERAEDLLAIVLTHGHEDHIGALPHLWPLLRCPVYATPFTASLVRTKLEEAGLLSEVPLRVVPVGGSLSIGPFDVRYVPVTHSIPEAHSLAIRTPVGLVVHSGDWKLDPDPVIGKPTDGAAFSALGDEGVLAFICDSTNVFRRGTSGAEGSLFRPLHEIIAGATGRVAVTTFASNVARLKTIIAAAHEAGRHVVVLGRSLWRSVQASRDTGYIDPRTELLTDDDFGYLPPERTLLLCTGCQGEPRGAMARIASGDHPRVGLSRGDTVAFSSKIIPGNEHAIARVQNELIGRGVSVLTEKSHDIHVSGHPSRDEMATMYGWIRPRVAVPVHGEARHLLEHAAFAASQGTAHQAVIRNGDMLRLSADGPEVVDMVPTGRLAVEGLRLAPVDAASIQARRRLMFNGLVTVVMIVGADGGLPVAPRVFVRGVPGCEDDAALESELIDALDELVDVTPRPRIRRDDQLEDAVRRVVRRVLKSVSDRRPPIEVDIVRLPGSAVTLAASGSGDYDEETGEEGPLVAATLPGRGRRR